MKAKPAALAVLMIVIAAIVPHGAHLPASAAAVARLDHPSVRFEKNAGQVPVRFDFVARGPGFAAGLNSSGITVFTGSGPKRLSFLGARPDARATAGESMELSTTYARRGNWVEGVESYRSVSYQDVYEGIDVVFHDGGGVAEFDFVLDPHVSPAEIAVRYEDGRIAVTGDGDLRVKMDGPDLVLPRPRAFQGKTQTSDVPVRYRLLGRDTFGFTVGDYDEDAPLVIDPVMTYSTYVGGTALDVPAAMESDSDGNIYLTGRTTSVDVPLTAPIGGAKPGRDDIFVLKLAPDGSGPIAAMYLGGSQVDIPFGIDVDGNGAAYVTGMTCSEDFPVTANAFQRKKGGGCDSFVTKIRPDGETIAYSTFLGGKGLDQAQAIAVGGGGAAVLVGEVDTPRRVRGGFQESYAGGERDAFVTKLAPDGKSIRYFTFLGGRGDDRARAVELDEKQRAIVVGFTDSTDFPVRRPFQRRKAGPATGDVAADAFVTKVGREGDSLEWSTYFGGRSGDAAYALDVGESGDVVFGGRTDSPDFPVRDPWQAEFGGDAEGDGFITRLTSGGQGLTFSTYVGGSGFDRILGLVAEASGAITFAGRTNSVDISLKDPLQPSYGGGVSDALLGRFVSGASQLSYLTYFGGSSYDRAYAIFEAPGAAGNVTIAGETTSPDLPTRNAMQESYAGDTDGFIVDVLLCDCP